MPASRLNPVSFTQVTITDDFWRPRQDINAARTIAHGYKQCKETGRIDAFRLTWKPGDEPKPHYFWDSDVAKWIEAASYTLVTHPNPELEAVIDDVISLIASAQHPDGYLNVYFTAVEPEKRWSNLGMWHELYCAGHLIEAAVAHFEATGKRQLLDVVCRYADYIASVFGPNGREGCPGHQEIELALVKLYRVTGERKYLELSQFFLDQRGQQPSVFQKELERLEHHDPDAAAHSKRYFIRPNGTFDSSFCQDHLPVREQSEVVGHAVRAMYMYSAMVDVGIETEDEGLLAATRRLWENVCLRRMYVTGGIGSFRGNEGFTTDYDLPNETAYCETCAAIGLVFWNHRMLHVDGDSRYADIVERALYNGVISGISLDGDRFFYDNPLASRGDHHRQEWFGCACCPTNIVRILASLGGYIDSEGRDSLTVHHYISSRATLRVSGRDVNATLNTRYPWDGRVELTVDPAEPSEFEVRLRVPGWCRGFEVTVNGQAVASPMQERGYIMLRRRWEHGDVIALNLHMPIERVHAHPDVRQNAGQVALQRGPIVYCLEGVDHDVPLHRIELPKDGELTAVYDPDLLGGVVKLEGEALAMDDADWTGALYRVEQSRRTPVKVTAVPYYAWDNREPGEMRVWVRG